MEIQEVLLKPGPITKEDLPEINFSHIENLTDDTGIIQHALYDIPNRKEGYCIDDNARALLLMVLASRVHGNDTASRLLPVYLGFVHYMQNSEGTFRNFMCYDRSCQEEVGSEDSFGRTLMALGYLVNGHETESSIVQAGKEIFARAYPHCDKLVSLRGMANSIIGLCQFIYFNHPDDLKKEMVIRLADKLVDYYRKNSDKQWRWFDSILSYDNAILPWSLFSAYELTKKEEYLEVAEESLHFLDSKVFRGREIISPIGNKGWLTRNGLPAKFDQQGIDAMALVLCYAQAFQILQDEKFLSRLFASYKWFLGANDLCLSLYDPRTGGCSDGLQEEGINYNQGAESTLAYWIAHMIVADIIQ